MEFTKDNINVPVQETVPVANDTKKQKIQWDEETIAEHDKERGSRQKIDEAPTPFRYMSESDQSEAESGSDGEHLSRRRRSSSGDAVNNRSRTTSTGSIQDSWNTFTAKLHYEKHLQDMSDAQPMLDEGSLLEIPDDHTTDFGELLLSARSMATPPAVRKALHFPAGMGSPMASKRVLPGGSNGSGDCKRVHKSVHINGGVEQTAFRNKSFDVAAPAAPASPISTPPAAQSSGLAPDSGDREHRQDFLDKRAGHYNEFKILQAMRAKMMEEDDEEDDGDSGNDVDTASGDRSPVEQDGR